MSKKLFLAIAAVMLAAFAYAQPRAIGVRLGYGAEVSYQHSLSDSRMLTIDAGVPAFAGIEAAVTHDWIDPFNTSVPWNEKGEWHWYMGVGAGAAWYWGSLQSAGGVTYASGALGLGVAGRVGIEYDFWFPLQLAVDWRPVIGPGLSYESVSGAGQHESNVGIGFYTGGLYAGAIALSVRYLF